MALVYLARHAVFDERFALKVLLPNLATNPKVLERFRREAQVQFRFHHEHIVRVTDYVEEGGIAALAMEYVDGATLDVHLTSTGPLAWPAALELLLPVVSALAYAHQQGVVHRDLKPGNVLLDQRLGQPGVPKVADFGIAKVLDSEAGLTGTNARMGTWGYMAPEQFRGAKEVDARADVFALGILLWEAVAGRLPFNPEDQLAVMETYSGRVVIPRLDEVAECPAWLADVVAQAASIDPAGRFQDAGVLGRVLERHDLAYTEFPIANVEQTVDLALPGQPSKAEQPNHKGKKTGAALAASCNPPDSRGGRQPATTSRAAGARPAALSDRELSEPEGDGGLQTIAPPSKFDESAPTPPSARSTLWNGSVQAIKESSLLFVVGLVIVAYCLYMAWVSVQPATAPRLVTSVAAPVAARQEAPKPTTTEIAKTNQSPNPTPPPEPTPTPAARLIVNGDTVYDNVTKLTWQRTVPATRFDWGQAKAHCIQMAWRLPTGEEFESLVGNFRTAHIDRRAFPQKGAADWYWTTVPDSWRYSQTHERGDIVLVGLDYKLNETGEARVRCVR